MDKMAEIEMRFAMLEKKMDRIIELLERDCKKMSDHIDFVEQVYDTVKSPLYFIMNKVNSLKLKNL